MKLSELNIKDKAVITKVKGRGAFRKRIMEMGFVKGKIITVVKDAPLKDPIEYNIMGYEVSLRKSEAELIEVTTINEENGFYLNHPQEQLTLEEILQRKATEKGKIINVALVGNPNCGKTTFFNHASGSKEQVGNYSGVTVDAKKAKFKYNDYTFNITDLPGTYSLTAYSPEELYVRKFIFEEIPDIVINMVDASNLERNLYLTTQLIDLDIKVVIGLNMYDELLAKGDKLDYTALGKMLGIPIVPMVSSKGKGIAQLFETAIKVYEDNSPIVRHIHINYGKEIEKCINNIQSEIKTEQNLWLTDKISSRFLAIKLLEYDKDALKIIKNCNNFDDIKAVLDYQTKKLKNVFSDDNETIITDARYGFVSGAIKETFKEGTTTRRKQTEIIDTFLTHRLFGFPVFFFFMWLTFQATFTLGEYPMNWIDSLVAWIGGLFETYMGNGMLKDLIVDGILAGVGGVIIFLPNILLLFFFISLMEDTGYMARVAFIMDKIMHKIGLHGKSFIPLLMGFGCNVPAVMSTRTLQNRSDRLLTMLINPFMSCSARLPVYLVLAAAFFPNNAGTVIFSMYLIGIALAVIAALIFKRTLFKTKEAPFVMELPPYRIPTLNSTIKHMWHKGQQYLKKMGGIILVASILIWALGYFPLETEESIIFDKKIQTIENTFDKKIEAAETNTLSELLLLKKDSTMQALLNEKESIRQENSFIGKMGKAVEPIIDPLGFDWKMGVSIITGVAAKEIVVSTMGVLYQTDTGDENTENLQIKLRNEVYQTGEMKGEPVITPLKAYVFMLFILIYFPCIAVIAAIKKESGSWKWALFTIGYTTGLAWLISFLVFQIGSLFI